MLLAQCLQADVPPGFTRISIESDTTTMAVVRRALQDPSITAIREVGIKDGFAVVMTASRESGAPTPDYDLWSIYNVALATEKSRLVISGYGVKLVDWVGRSADELAITYYSCWECEATKMFTTLHFESGAGWNARWRADTEDARLPRPGAVAFQTDVGQPYDDADLAEQVFAVIQLGNDSIAVGYWLHSRNSKTGKSRDEVEQYSIDPTSGADRVERLTGSAARKWERQICTRSRILAELSSGQNSKACRAVLQAPIR